MLTVGVRKLVIRSFFQIEQPVDVRQDALQQLLFPEPLTTGLTHPGFEIPFRFGYCLERNRYGDIDLVQVGDVIDKR